MRNYISDCCGAGCWTNARLPEGVWYCEKCDGECDTIRTDAPLLVKLREKLVRVEALIAYWDEAMPSENWYYFSDALRQALEDPK